MFSGRIQCNKKGNYSKQPKLCNVHINICIIKGNHEATGWQGDNEDHLNLENGKKLNKFVT